MRERIEGLIAAAYSPMDSRGLIHLDVIGDYAEYLSRNGVRGVFVGGTMGESLSLTVPERLELARCWRDAAPEGFKVIVHVGHTSLEASRELAEQAQEIGAWGIGAIPPVFFKPADIRQNVEFSASIAERAPELPFYYYHIPGMTGVNIPLIDYFEEAADRIPNLAGAKFTCTDIMQFRMCAKCRGGKFDIVMGLDEYMLTGLFNGARGAIGSTYNFAAPLYNGIIEAFGAGDYEHAHELQDRSHELLRLCANFQRMHFLPVTKAIMKIIGCDVGFARAPLANPGQGQVAALEAELEAVGFFEYCGK